MNTLRISSHHPKWIAQSSRSPTSVYRILRSFAFVDVTRLRIPFCSTQPCACSCALGLSWTDKIMSGRLCTCKLKTQLRPLVSKTQNVGTCKHTFGQSNCSKQGSKLLVSGKSSSCPASKVPQPMGLLNLFVFVESPVNKITVFFVYGKSNPMYLS